ncbi:MAG: GTP-binding protein [Patescibacteria group bacterium]|nr:GTP-binding protein [Patescibacteria group bacterium]
MAKNNSKNDVPQNVFPPVVSVVGHVDHGKTTLLDAIRKTNIAQREHGGITQKIGASNIETTHDGIKRRITFIDTPGHETFFKMRSRGVQVADIGLLVVSAVDGVMPQTRESINLLLEAKTPFIVVLTKSDLLEKNPEKTKQQLLKEGIALEGYGGDIPIIEVSAKTGHNIKELLDLIILVFDMKRASDKDILRSEKGEFEAVVIESKLDPKSGPKATLVVRNGTVFNKDELYCEEVKGKVRAIINDRGQHLQNATVGEAVEVLGFNSTPRVGSIVYKTEEKIKQVDLPQPQKAINPFDVSFEAEKDVLPIILCADTLGTLEAILNALPEKVLVVSKKTGDITSADVLLAKSSSAIIIGFNIKIAPEVMRLAKTEHVLLKNYTIIYELLDELKDVIEGRKEAIVEEIYGTAKVLASFPFEKTKVLGIKVVEGRVARGDKVRLMRGENILGESSVNSVRQGKETVSKIEKGQEGGVIISPFLDFTIGDMLVCHR